MRIKRNIYQVLIPVRLVISFTLMISIVFQDFTIRYTISFLYILFIRFKHSLHLSCPTRTTEKKQYMNIFLLEIHVMNCIQ